MNRQMRSPNETNLSTANCFVHWWVVNRQSPKNSQKSSISDSSLWLIFSLNNPSLDFFLPYLSSLNHYTENWSSLWSINTPYRSQFQTATSGFYLHLIWSFHQLLQNLLIFLQFFTAMPYKRLCGRGKLTLPIVRVVHFDPFFFFHTCLQKCKHLSHSQALSGGRTFLSTFNYRYNKVLFHSEGSYAW